MVGEGEWFLGRESWCWCRLGAWEDIWWSWEEEEVAVVWWKTPGREWKLVVEEGEAASRSHKEWWMALVVEVVEVSKFHKE